LSLLMAMRRRASVLLDTSMSLSYPELLQLRNTEPDVSIVVDLDIIGQKGPGTKSAEGYRWQTVCYYAAAGHTEHALRISSLGTFDCLDMEEAVYFLSELAISALDGVLDARLSVEISWLIRELSKESDSLEQVTHLRIAAAVVAARQNPLCKSTDLANHIADLRYTSLSILVFMHRLAESRDWYDNADVYRSYFLRIAHGLMSLRQRSEFVESIIRNIFDRLGNSTSQC